VCSRACVCVYIFICEFVFKQTFPFCSRIEDDSSDVVSTFNHLRRARNLASKSSRLSSAAAGGAFGCDGPGWEAAAG
jgi:hypothetical protein